MRNDGESVKDIAKALRVDRAFVYRAVFYFKRQIKASLEEKKTTAKRKRALKSREKLQCFIDRFLNKESLSNVTVPKIITSAKGTQWKEGMVSASTTQRILKSTFGLRFKRNDMKN